MINYNDDIKDLTKLLGIDRKSLGGSEDPNQLARYAGITATEYLLHNQRHELLASSVGSPGYCTVPQFSRDCSKPCFFFLFLVDTCAS